jgi:hypothetical protein
MKLFTAIYDDSGLLSHFLRHYERVGVTEFYVAIDQQIDASIFKLPP